MLERSSGSILIGVTFCNWIFLFSWNKASDANIAIIAILVHYEKNLLLVQNKFGSYDFQTTMVCLQW